MRCERSAYIAGIGAYAPPKILSNADLEKIVETSDEWITSRTGIKERRIAEKHEATSDIAIKAVEMALKDADMKPEELDLIVSASAIPDMVFPATACILQDKIGAKNAAAFDIQAGCSGFIYGLSVGYNFIASGMYNNVLVVGADILTRSTNWEDRGTCVLFGDAGGAVVLKPSEKGSGFLSFYLGADGSGAELLRMQAGGTRLPASHDTVDKRLHYIEMSGNEVFKFAVKIMGDASLSAIELAGLKPENVSCFVPHQANVRIIDAAIRRLKLDKDKVFVNVDKYGNTSCGSVPMALYEAYKTGRIKKGDIVVLVGFGAGLTWGSTVMVWDKD
ncbi:MAG: beta-ketoacyl-ACP synthase III [Armatimonadota bacterium]